MFNNILSIDLWFELETECNLNCIFCYNFWKDNKQKKTRQLSENDIKIVLDNIFTNIKCENIALSGGEPFLRSDIFEIIDFLGKKNINITLVTNSLALNKSKIEFLKKYNISFEIPFHSTNKTIHNYLTQNNSWEKTLENIINLKKTFNVTPVFVATKKNLNNFLDYLETMYLLDINKIIFNRFIPGGTGLLNLDSLEITDKEIEKILMIADKLAKKLQIEIILGTPINFSQAIREELSNITLASCPISKNQTYLFIDSEGNLKQCNHSSKVLGNLLKDNIYDILLKRENNFSKVLNNIKMCEFIN